MLSNLETPLIHGITITEIVLVQMMNNNNNNNNNERIYIMRT